MANPETLEVVFDFITDYIQREGISPSQREIARGCFITPPTVLRYLDLLEAQNRIHRVRGVARGIHLVSVRAQAETLEDV